MCFQARFAWTRFVLGAFVFVAIPTGGGTADDQPQREAGELHVVCLYEGVERTGNEIHGGRAVVTVDRPRTKVTLALVSYESIRWEIKLTPDTQLEKVILGGYERQTLKEQPAGTVVVDASRRDGSAPKLSYGGYKVDSIRFRGLVHELTKFSKLPIASLYSTYRFKPEDPIIINQVQDDPRLSSNYPVPTPLAELPEIGFAAIHQTGSERTPTGVKASFGDFTLAGPKTDTLKPLPTGVRRLAYDPASKKYFGIAGHSIVEVDLVNQKATPLEMVGDVPKPSWPADLAFDSKRKQLLFVARNYLYTCDLETKTWKAIAERPNLSSLCYHPHNDTYYGLGFVHGEEGELPVLREMNAQGAIVDEKKLGPPIIPGMLGGRSPFSTTQIIPAAEYLVLVNTPDGRFSDEGSVQAACIYLIEPKSGKVWLTAKKLLEIAD